MIWNRSDLKNSAFDNNNYALQDIAGIFNLLVRKEGKISVPGNRILVRIFGRLEVKVSLPLDG